MQQSIRSAWDYLWDKLFCPKTSLFYDYRVSTEKDGAVCTLPSAEMVQKQIPNPCGWGVGMEDSVINNATMLDTVIARYEVTKSCEMQQYADKLYEGLKLCATVSDRSGFIVRSVSPFDGVSHYINSSRDQYTHWVYSAYRFFESELSSGRQKEEIKRILVSVAERMENDVTEEHGYELLREDGKIGIVQQMWGQLGKHEYLRLPMFYAAAYQVSGCRHWNDMYLKYRGEAMDRSYDIDFAQYEGIYPILQMQYSVALLYRIEPAGEYKDKYRTLLKRAADYYQNIAIQSADELCKPEHRNDFNYRYKDWRQIPAKFNGYIGGMPYYNPTQCQLSENTSFYPVRDIGDAAAITALYGKVPKKVLKAVVNVADLIDYNRHYSSAPLNLVNAYWLCKEMD